MQRAGVRGPAYQAGNWAPTNYREPVILLLLGRGLPATEAEQRQVLDR